MKVKCQSCQKVYNIPKEKLPLGKKISLSCSACKGRIVIDLRSRPALQKPPFSAEPETKEPATKPLASTSYKRKRPSGLALKSGILRSMVDLPAMPQVVSKAQEIISRPDSKLKELVKIVEIDQSISARILKLANSTYYGLSGKVSTVHHASVLLGYKTLGEVISVAGISNLMAKTLEGYGMKSGDLWQHSLAVGVGSRIIANKRNQELGNDAFLAGLLHDAGKLVLDRHVFERKQDFELLMQNGHATFLTAEKEVLGFDHSEIASEFCQKWNIPDTQSQAIKFHHYPSLSEGNELAYILHMADFIATLSGLGGCSDDMQYQLEDGTMEFLTLQEEEIDDIRSDVVDSVEEILSGMN